MICFHWFEKAFKGLIIGIPFFPHSQQHWLIQEIDLYKLLYQLMKKLESFQIIIQIIVVKVFKFWNSKCYLYFVIFWHHFEEINFYVFFNLFAQFISLYIKWMKIYEKLKLNQKMKWGKKIKLRQISNRNFDFWKIVNLTFDKVA